MESREIAKLKPNPRNPRGKVIEDAALLELAASIESQGVLQPVTITPNNVIVAGHRRVAAAKIAKLKTVPVVIKQLSEPEQLQYMLIENLQREDLNALQEGSAYGHLITHGLSASQVAKAIGITQQRVTNCIATLSLPKAAQGLFITNSLDVSCASLLADLTSDEDKVYWAMRTAVEKRSASWLQRMIDKEGVVKRPSSVPGEAEVAKRLAFRLGLMDESLDRYPRFRNAQSLLRQAARILKDAATQKAA